MFVHFETIQNNVLKIPRKSSSPASDKDMEVTDMQNQKIRKIRENGITM